MAKRRQMALQINSLHSFSPLDSYIDAHIGIEGSMLCRPCILPRGLPAKVGPSPWQEKA